MRLTARANLALRALMVCAVNTDRMVRKQDVARAINASENHLAQVINKLAQNGFIATQRGQHGGFSLARAASSIGVGDVFRAFEGDLPLVECFSDHNTCPLTGHCRIGKHLKRAVDAFYGALDEVYLSDLTDCNSGLEHILQLQGPHLPQHCQARPLRIPGTAAA